MGFAPPAGPDAVSTQSPDGNQPPPPLVPRRFRRRGDFGRELRQAARDLNVRRAQDKAARDQAAAERPGYTGIPTSGPGRRRAKALRNARAVLGPLEPVPEPAW